MDIQSIYTREIPQGRKLVPAKTKKKKMKKCLLRSKEEQFFKYTGELLGSSVLIILGISEGKPARLRE